MNIDEITREEVEQWMEARRQSLNVDVLTIRALDNDQYHKWSADIGKKCFYADSYCDLMKQIREYDPEAELRTRVAKLKSELAELEGLRP